MVFLAPIVEGHGEIEAVPTLLRRIAKECNGTVQINNPIRVKSGSFLNNNDYFSRMVSLAAAKAAQNTGFVLILLDCDDECPAVLGPRILERARNVRGDVGIIVVLLYREYETIFLTAAASLRGHFGLPPNLQPPADPTSIRNAKGWLGNYMDVAYDPILHQRELSRLFDMTQAKQNHSFNRFYNIIEHLVS